MNMKQHFKWVDTLQDAEEMMLLCGMRTHRKLFLCTINTHQVMESQVDEYEMNLDSLRRVIGKIYSRQQRRGLQICIHDFDAILEMVNMAEDFQLPEDIKLEYIDLLDFNYKGQHYQLESVECLEQNVFKYFDLYGKLNSMLYVGIYRIFEYLISIIDGDYIDLSTINIQTEKVNAKLQSNNQKQMVEEGTQSYFNDKQLIVLLEGESSMTEMVKDYTLKLMRMDQGRLVDLKNIISYSKRYQSSKEKCLQFVKEFYGTCRYYQGKWDLDEILVIGNDAEEYMRMIYNTADVIQLIDLSHFIFIDVMKGEWHEKWEKLIGHEVKEKLDFEMIKEALKISDHKIGIDAKNYASLYRVTVNALLLRLLTIHEVDSEICEQFLMELQAV